MTSDQPARPLTLAAAAAAGDLANLSDADLGDLYNRTEDAGIRAAIESICARRDLADRKHKRDQERWAATYSAWHDYAHAQFLAAEAATRGYMCNRSAPESFDPWQFWTGSADQIKRYASEELRNWFLDHPRLTVSAYHRQVRAERRAARESAESAD